MAGYGGGGKQQQVKRPPFQRDPEGNAPKGRDKAGRETLRGRGGAGLGLDGRAMADTSSPARSTKGKVKRDPLDRTASGKEFDRVHKGLRDAVSKNGATPLLKEVVRKNTVEDRGRLKRTNDAKRVAQGKAQGNPAPARKPPAAPSGPGRKPSPPARAKNPFGVPSTRPKTPVPAGQKVDVADAAYSLFGAKSRK